MTCPRQQRGLFPFDLQRQLYKAANDIGAASDQFPLAFDPRNLINENLEGKSKGPVASAW
jgi:hypothetical protein